MENIIAKTKELLANPEPDVVRLVKGPCNRHLMTCLHLDMNPDGNEPHHRYLESNKLLRYLEYLSREGNEQQKVEAALCCTMIYYYREKDKPYESNPLGSYALTHLSGVRLLKRTVDSEIMETEQFKQLFEQHKDFLNSPHFA